MYEYETSYFPVAYTIQEKEPVLAGNSLPTAPDPGSLDYNPDYIEHLKYRGDAGWELITVQPLLRACYHERHSIGYSLTAGYYLFWKRKK